MNENQPVCVVTGGSAGVGLAIAHKFGDLGYRLVVCGRRQDALDAAKQSIAAKGTPCEAIALDLGIADAVGQLVQTVHEKLGRIDILVNNAGAALCMPVDRMSKAEFRQTLAVNVEAVFHATQAVWPVMKEQGQGVIVNISSLASVDPFPGFSVYGACKSWVNLFTKATADEGKPFGIRVYSVALGAVETQMLRGLFPDFPDDQTLTPQEVADFVASLASDAMIPATGQTFLFKK
ncbi:MAG: SDR family NAD(P)-dependent oxidoreductase [Gemmataceae bacterium]